jgi:protein arginine kinase
MKTSNPPFFSFLKGPWYRHSNPVWLGTTLTLYRNLEKYLFPHKAGLDKRQQIIPIINQQIARVAPKYQFQTVLAENIGPVEKEYLVEHFLTHESLNQTHAGESFLISADGDVLVGVNLQNHLTFHIIENSVELGKSLAKLVKLETALGDALGYSFSPRFGFLTADPLSCGTALSASIFLQLPALIFRGKIQAILEKNSDDLAMITTLQGTGKERIGDIVVVTNNYTLGVTEEQIISSINVLSTKLQVAEASERSEIKKKDDPDAKDRVSRAYAVLMHSYQIETIEAMNALSWLKLGVSLGWVENISIEALNDLFFNCRRAHLISHLGDRASPELLPHKRAEFIHSILKNVALHL